MMQQQPELQRTIWIYWGQGFENAPDVVRLCLRSWISRNPGWRVVELSNANVAEYVDERTLARIRALKNIRIQKFANLIRLYLIGRYGGVWVDATCFCCRPLDDWLHDYMGSGFFAFRRRADAWLKNPRNLGLRGYLGRSDDRIVASWFLASVRGNPLPSIWFERSLELFSANRFRLQGSPKGLRRVKIIERILNRNAKLVQWWTRPLVAKTVRVYPYFILHYHFARLVSEDEVCRDIWKRTPVFLAFNLTRLVHSVTSPVTHSIMSHLNKSATPMHKLSWKYRQEDYEKGCLLDYLAESLR